MKKAFNTSIDAEILQRFKDKCKEENLPINIVLEKFMKGYVEDKFTFTMEYSANNGKSKEQVLNRPKRQPTLSTT